MGANVQEIGVSAFSGDKNLTTLVISADSQLTTIDANAFQGTGLTAVHFPASLTTIGAGAFESATDLADITFAGQAADADLTIGADAFAYDGELTTLTLPANLVSIGKEAFAADNLKDASGNTIGGLTSVTFGDGSRLATIEDSAFIYDTFLKQITLPDSVTTIGNQAFLGDSALTQITLPAGLQQIGDSAFIYNDSLTTVDTSRATQLTKIGNRAFEYSGLTGSGQTNAAGEPVFMMPDSVQSIGNYAFAGNHLTNLTLNDGLQVIGAGAFTYNGLSGSLTLPDTVTTVGEKAFYGNRLQGVTVPTAATVGEDAFSYNRITQLSANTNNSAVAQNQYAAYFGNSSDVTIDTLFDTQVGNLTNRSLVLTGLTNGVTYDQATGTFTIPSGITGFTFDWSLPDATGNNLYAGTYQVVLNDPDIKVVDGQAWYKDNWTPELNFISAEQPNGAKLDYADLTVTIKDANGNVVAADQVTQTPGTYAVTYSYQGHDAQTIKLTVSKRQATYTLGGTQTVQYTGTTPTLVADGNYYVTMSDGFAYNVKDGDLEIVPATTTARTMTRAAGNDTTGLPNVGIYHVQLKQSAIDRVKKEANGADLFDWTDKGSTATLTIAPVAVTVAVKEQPTKVARTDDPKLTFVVTANDDATQTPLTDFPLTVTYERQTGEKVGMYAYTLGVQGATAADYDVTYTPVALTITAAPVTVSGKDYTLTIGAATPTAADFSATGTDENADPVTAAEIAVDLGNADLTTPGDYPVTLTYGGVQQLVTLHVVAATSGGDNGNQTTDPGTGNEGGTTTPTQPVTPDKPAKPIKPVKPVAPIPGDSPYVVSDQGMHDSVSAGTSGEPAVQHFLVKSGGAAALAQVDTANSTDHQPTSLGAASVSNRVTTGAEKQSIAQPKSKMIGTSKPTAAELPQTGETQAPWWAFLGALLGGTSLIGWQRKRHE